MLQEWWRKQDGPRERLVAWWAKQGFRSRKKEEAPEKERETEKTKEAEKEQMLHFATAVIELDPEKGEAGLGSKSS